jgi:hypothetical protein
MKIAIIPHNNTKVYGFKFKQVVCFFLILSYCVFNLSII